MTSFQSSLSEHVPEEASVPEKPFSTEHLETMVFSPGFCCERSGAIAFSPVHNRRFSIRASDLAYLIASKTLSLQNSSESYAQVNSMLATGWNEWLRHEWVPSIDLYLASRQIAALDRQDFRSGHAKGIERYLSADPLPFSQPPDGKVFELPEPGEPIAHESIADLAIARRTTRMFKRDPVPISHLSGWLWNGLKDVRRTLQEINPHDPSSYLRSHGSAFDYYLVIYNVEALVAGVYWYDIEKHQLVLVAEGCRRAEMKHVLCGQNAPMSAAWTLVLATDFKRYQWRYRHEKGLRTLFTDCGWIAQNLIMYGAGYKLGALTTPATRDSDLCQILGVPPIDWAPLYTVTFGLNPRA